MAFIAKILKVLPLILTSGVAIIQTCIKFGKELVTLIINLFFPFFPDNGKFEATVLKVRDFINKVDIGFEKVKEALLKLI